MSEKVHPTISVIIPTLNAEAYLADLVGALRRQRLVPGEILIVDSDSSDGTREIVNELGLPLLQIERGDFDHGGTRSLAAERTSGEFVLFLTQDVQIQDPNAIENLLAPLLQDDRIAAAYGRQLPFGSADTFARSIRRFNYGEESYRASDNEKSASGIRKPFLSNNFSVYRRSVMDQLDWFGDCKICSEDLYAGACILRAGYDIAYVSNALVFHSHNFNTRQYLQRYFDIGVFHARHRWIRRTYGGAIKEGQRFVRHELNYLWRQRSYGKFPKSIFRSFAKFLGYRLGIYHEYLPPGLRPVLSRNKVWWRDQHCRQMSIVRRG